MEIISKKLSSKKSQIFSKNCSSKLKTSLTESSKFWPAVFRLSFVAFCFLTPLSYAEISHEQLDPTNLLFAHLDSLSKNTDTPNAETQTQQDTNLPNLTAKLPQDSNAPKNLIEPQDVIFQVLESATLPAEPQQKKSRHSHITSQTLGIAPINFAAQLDEKLPLNSPISTEKPNIIPERKLRETRISIPNEQTDDTSKNKLKQIIEQIRSVEFKPQSETPNPIVALEPEPKTEPNETPTDTIAPKEPLEKQGKKTIDTPLKEIPQNLGTLPYQPLTDETIKMLENLLQKPETLNNPAELAEILFLSGRLKEAAVLYQQALNQTSPDKPEHAQNRAWFLFQIGNCLRYDDPDSAIKIFRQLITEYPDSTWTDPAKALDNLINWLQKDKPQSLLLEKSF